MATSSATIASSTPPSPPGRNGRAPASNDAPTMNVAIRNGTSAPSSRKIKNSISTSSAQPISATAKVVQNVWNSNSVCKSRSVRRMPANSRLPRLPSAT